MRSQILWHKHLGEHRLGVDLHRVGCVDVFSHLALDLITAYRPDTDGLVAWTCPVTAHGTSREHVTDHRPDTETKERRENTPAGWARLQDGAREGRAPQP